MLARLKAFLSIAAIILSILGVVTFSLFIFEEAIQMATFGTWPAQYANDWEQVMKGADTIESINHSMKTLNYAVGWIQPFSFFSYQAYGKATDYYVESLRKKTLAAAPECFVGRKVEFVFVPDEIQTEGSKIRLANGNIVVITSSIPETKRVRVSGLVEKDGDLIVIKADSIRPVR